MNQEVVTPKKKRWYKKKWPYILLILLFAGGGIAYTQFFQKDTEPKYETVKVTKGSLEQTVDATGNIESADEVGLQFEVVGKVANVLKNTGDEVKKDDIIANLELDVLNAQVSQASASVEKAKADVEKAKAGNTEEYLNSIKAKVDQAKATLDQTKAGYVDSIFNVESSIETAKNNLKLAEGGEDSEIVQDSYFDMVTLLFSIQTTLSKSLTEADNILGIDNTLSNVDFEDVLSALDSSKLNLANSKYQVAKGAKNEADLQINPLSPSSPHDIIDWTADVTEEALVTMKELLFTLSEVLNNTVPIGDLSQSELNTLKTNIQTARTEVSTQYTALINQTQSIKSAKNSYSSYLITFNKAVSNLANLKIKRDADIMVYEALLAQADANYEDAKNPPRQVDLASLEAGVAVAQASLAQAVANRDKAILKAPVDGIIGKIDMKVGEYVSLQNEIVKIISPLFEVKVDIPETDIIKVKKGLVAKVTLDAYGDDVEFEAQVIEIEKGETVIQDVVYYTVTLTLEDKDDEYEILNGMTANVVFFTNQKDNVLFVPSRTVISSGLTKYVRLLENGEVKDINVLTGLKGDNGLVEIISGLKEGQEIVIKVIE
ncbi:efflux RND transporter periplasmic adaptor subunit [Patescibacteria group bacterium]|nr:efflux RND transporter periplasmic adaptor subunit [Patescibacteria group bacterium]